MWDAVRNLEALRCLVSSAGEGEEEPRPTVQAGPPARSPSRSVRPWPGPAWLGARLPGTCRSLRKKPREAASASLHAENDFLSGCASPSPSVAPPTCRMEPPHLSPQTRVQGAALAPAAHPGPSPPEALGLGQLQSLQGAHLHAACCVRSLSLPPGHRPRTSQLVPVKPSAAPEFGTRSNEHTEPTGEAGTDSWTESRRTARGGGAGGRSPKGKGLIGMDCSVGIAGGGEDKGT